MLTNPCKAFLLALTSNLLLMALPGKVMAKSMVNKSFSTFSNDDASKVVQRVKREFECELMDANHRRDRWTASFHRIGAEFLGKMYSKCYWKHHPKHPYPNFDSEDPGRKKRAYNDIHPLTPRTKRKWECQLYNDDIDRIAEDVYDEISHECDFRDSLNRVKSQLMDVRSEVQSFAEEESDPPYREETERWLQQLRDYRSIISDEKRKREDPGINRTSLLGQILVDLDLALSTLNATTHHDGPSYVEEISYDYRDNFTAVAIRLGDAFITIEHELQRMRHDFFREAVITPSTYHYPRIEDLNERDKLNRLLHPMQVLREQVHNRTWPPSFPNWRMVSDWRRQMKHFRKWINNITLTREQAGIYRPRLDTAVSKLNLAIRALNFAPSSEIHPVYDVYRNLKNARYIIEVELYNMDLDHFQGAEVPNITSSERPTSRQVLMGVKEELGTLQQQVHDKAYSKGRIHLDPPRSALYEEWEQKVKREQERINDQIRTRAHWGISRPLLSNASTLLDRALDSLNTSLFHLNDRDYPHEYRNGLLRAYHRLNEASEEIDKELARMVQDFYQEVEYYTWTDKRPNTDDKPNTNLTEWDILSGELERVSVLHPQIWNISINGTVPNRGVLMDWRRQLRHVLFTITRVINQRSAVMSRMKQLDTNALSIFVLVQEATNDVLGYAYFNLTKAIPGLYSTRQFVNELMDGTRDPLDDERPYSYNLSWCSFYVKDAALSIRKELANMEESNRIRLNYVGVKLRDDLHPVILERSQNLNLIPNRDLMEDWLRTLKIFGSMVNDVRNKRKGTLNRYRLDTSHTALELAIRCLISSSNNLRNLDFIAYKKYLLRTTWMIRYARSWIQEQVAVIRFNPQADRLPVNLVQRRSLTALRSPLRLLKQSIQEISQNRSSNPPTSDVLRNWRRQTGDALRPVKFILRSRNGTLDRPYLSTASEMLEWAKESLIAVRNDFRDLSDGVDTDPPHFRKDLEIVVMLVRSARYAIEEEEMSMRQDENTR